MARKQASIHGIKEIESKMMISANLRKLMGTGCLLACSAMVAFAAGTPDETLLRAAMKAAGPAHGGLGKKIAAKDPSAAEDAKKLEAWFKGDTQKFFKKMKAEDGVTFSKTAAAEYKAIGKAAATSKWDEAAASHKKASATCQGCHGAHREKAADGSYKVK